MLIYRADKLKTIGGSARTLGGDSRAARNHAGARRRSDRPED